MSTKKPRISRCLKSLFPGGSGGRIENCDLREKLHDDAQWRLAGIATTNGHEAPSRNQSPTAEPDALDPTPLITSDDESDLSDGDCSCEEDSSQELEISDENIIVNARDLKLTIESNLVCYKCQSRSRTETQAEFFKFADQEKRKMIEQLYLDEIR